ncbi:MAG TPA: autotransporter outer membrane beta-barrel domain-containing protein, partial [Povalibacter sp.]|nr:autotransporter outer membrane beta-barrel domain-containing protein [Povalibacter sp.]
TADNSFTGTTTVNAGTLAIGDSAHPSATLSGGGTVSVMSGATFGGYGHVAGSVNNSGTIAVGDAIAAFAGQGVGTFSIDGTLTNAGTVQLADAVGNRLVVRSYAGSGGQIVMNAALAGDDSPSDQLVLNGGAATGQSVLRVINVGGAGAATPGNGIRLVDATGGATTTSDAFSLGNRLMAGPYEYTLFRGSRDASAPDSWFLRSELIDLPAEPPPTLPDYRPEVSLDTAVPSMALNDGLLLVGSLHERVGDEMLLQRTGEAGGPSGVWTRLIGQDSRWHAETGGIYADGPSFANRTFAVQAGLDLYRNERRSGHRDYLGVQASAGTDDGRVDHRDGSLAGRVDANAQSLGAYWTHFGPRGWYVDTVLLGTWHDIDTTSASMYALSTDGFFTSASLESGYPLHLHDGWSVEPQAQVIWQEGDLDDASDTAAEVRFSNIDSLTARIGARVARTWSLGATAADGQMSVWALANVWREFESNARTEFSAEDGFVPFHSDLRGTWGEIGAGMSVQVTDKLSAYWTVGYQRGFDDGIRSFNGNVGVRVNW